MKLRKSKTVAWIALLLIVVVLVLNVIVENAWWSFIDIFFAFMMMFCHLVSLYIEKFNKVSAGKLEMISFVCGILMIVAFIAEYVVESVIFKL